MNTKITLIILGILIIIISILVFTSLHNIEEFESKKIYGITFGGGSQNYIDAVNRMKNELLQTEVFDTVIGYTDNDLRKDVDFWEKNRNFIENNKRGYGYWIWKPYLIMKTMELMNDNDILLFLDAGCEIVNNEKTKELMMGFINKCNETEILYSPAGHNEKLYNKMDLIDYMKLNNDQIKDSMQYQTGVIFIKKNNKMLDFIKEWYSIAISNNYHLIDDSASKIPNDQLFIEHRHDQAIFSLLTKSEKYKLNNENNLIIDPYPIKTSRKRHG